MRAVLPGHIAAEHAQHGFVQQLGRRQRGIAGDLGDAHRRDLPQLRVGLLEYRCERIGVPLLPGFQPLGEWQLRGDTGGHQDRSTER